MPVTLYAATSNKGKLAEFAVSASTAGFAVAALPGLDGIAEPVEDAATFMGNAEIKAVTYSLHAPGMMVFADDSGLEVEALGGEPGVRSARYADDAGYQLDSKHSRDDRNNSLIVARLTALPQASRDARFVCALAVARDGEVIHRAEASVAGEMLLKPRGTNGFGYDPLFLLREMELTMAELAPEQKWEVSHRGRAFRMLLGELVG